MENVREEERNSTKCAVIRMTALFAAKAQCWGVPLRNQVTPPVNIRQGSRGIYPKAPITVRMRTVWELRTPGMYSW